MKPSEYLFEFEDQTWFPAVIRKGMMDYLRFLFRLLPLYKPVVPLLNELLLKTGSEQMIDLCSGGGGPLEQIMKDLNQIHQRSVSIVLTDKFPNEEAFQMLQNKLGGHIKYSPESVDAMDVPPQFKGMRTMFSGIHHFSDEQTLRILQNTVDAGEGIAIFDGGRPNLAMIAGILILHPTLFFFATPFIRPFRFSRILFTYLIPIIPLCTIWDGLISASKLYSPERLLTLAHQTKCYEKKYNWKSGYLKSRFGLRISYLTGYPILENRENSGSEKLF